MLELKNASKRVLRNTTRVNYRELAGEETESEVNEGEVVSDQGFPADVTSEEEQEHLRGNSDNCSKDPEIDMANFVKVKAELKALLFQVKEIIEDFVDIEDIENMNLREKVEMHDELKGLRVSLVKCYNNLQYSYTIINYSSILHKHKYKTSWH